MTIKSQILVLNHKQNQSQAKKLKVNNKLYRKIGIVKTEEIAKSRMG